ncbi:hypothetical protein ACFQJ7_03445 [Halovenus rubra]|uniref:Exonuclease RecJ n=2 Tax=Halovenus rubra TaxID=869890 RepID=A0ABD5X7D9_9EURY|nr:hypothetical protein [Halovenus rubra]
MSTTGRPEKSAPVASDIASRIQDAGLVRVVAAATGDAVAATALLTMALDTHGVAHQSSVVALPEPADRDTDADVTVGIGRPVADAEVILGAEQEPASATALSVATTLGTADYELALAGIIAGGTTPTSDVLAAAADRGIDRRPGIATPTSDRADGLAYSSLVHASFSGDIEAAKEVLAEIDADSDEEMRRSLGSFVAFDVCADEASTPQAADAVEPFLRPLSAPGGRLDTVEGYADVLDAIAREQPAMAIALALGGVDPTETLDAWRRHTESAHEAVRSASTGRYDGLYVVQCDGDKPLGTVARLVADYRSPEPLVLAVDDSEALAVPVSRDEFTGHLGSRLDEASTAVGGIGRGTATLGRAHHGGDPTDFIVAFREGAQ